MNRSEENRLTENASSRMLAIRVRGHLDEGWSDWLGGLRVQLLEHGETLMFGPILDQSALMGILNRLHGLNLALLSVNEYDSEAALLARIHAGSQIEPANKFSEEKMKEHNELNSKLETIAWGALFILWGITELSNSIPDGVGALGIGLILIGLNALRVFNGIPTSGFTTTLGILAVVLGGLELMRSFGALPFTLPVFPILLLAFGAILMGRALLRAANG